MYNCRMPSYLTLQCPSCGGRTRFTSGADRFTCDYCGNEHLFQLPAARAVGRAASQPEEKLPAPQPRQVIVEKNSEVLKFTWRWFTPKYIALAFFCAAWDGFLCFWYGVALSGQAPWIMLVFPVFHLAVGVFLTYSTLAGFLNRTTITVGPQTFIVHHDPAPWPGEVNTPVSNLAQLYCKEKRQRTKSGENFTYELYAALRDGRELKLVTNLESPEIALFLEQQIEGYLRISDRRVVGELAV